MSTLMRPLMNTFKPSRYLNTAQYIKLNTISEPVYLFSGATLLECVDAFQRLFIGELSYAVKANPEPLLLNSLWNAGVSSFDVASVGEIALITERFIGAHCHYNNPIRSDEMTSLAAHKYGVRSFAVDDLAGLNQVVALGLIDVEISVRFKLDHFDAAYDFGSKFGADFKQATAILKKAKSLGMRCSLTFHPGSQCADSMMHAKHIKVAAQISKNAGVKLHRLNVGGGFPLPYKNTPVASLQQYMQEIHAAVKHHFGVDAPKLLCEPGRALVGSSTSLLTQVIRIRENGDVFINDGVYGGLQEQSLVKLDLPYCVWRGEDLIYTSVEEEGNLSKVTVFGPTCDPVDKLPNKLALPKDIQEGDFIEFGLLGAYGSATATRFNSFKSEKYVEVQSGFSD